jgi:hypothetical protein
MTDGDIKYYDGNQQKLIHKQKNSSVKCTTKFSSILI